MEAFYKTELGKTIGYWVHESVGGTSLIKAYIKLFKDKNTEEVYSKQDVDNLLEKILKFTQKIDGGTDYCYKKIKENYERSTL